jgi:hypothetical protein
MNLKIASRILVLIYGWCLIGSCSSQKEDLDNPRPVIFQYDLNNLELDDAYAGPENRGVISNTQMIREASGMAACRSNSAVLWVHNDRGNPNHLHAMGVNGENLGYFWVRGTGNRDWEDMCIGPGPVSGIHYVYIGDIGDNQAQYNSIFVYRFPEPDMKDRISASIDDVDPATVVTLEFKYPDGPRDAETLMIDPWTKDLYIVSKRESRSSVYRARFPFEENEVNTLIKIGEFPFNRALAGDISADGNKIVIKTDDRIYIWKRSDNESITSALSKPPKLLPYFVEPQGETFAWSMDGNHYFTLSELANNIPPRLYAYRRK